jgi:hypothetical protein
MGLVFSDSIPTFPSISSPFSSLASFQCASRVALDSIFTPFCNFSLMRECPIGLVIPSMKF